MFRKSITNYVIRQTFFKQFVAAENNKDLVPVMKELNSAGVAGILDYAAEGDLEDTREEREDEVVARTYSYEGEKKCDAATKVFEQCIRTARDAALEGSRPFAAIKLTALGNPLLLKRMSIMAVEQFRLFSRIDAKVNPGQATGVLTLPKFKRGFSEYFDVKTSFVEELFESASQGKEVDGEPYIDRVDWARSVDMDTIAMLVESCIKPGPLLASALTDEELKLGHNMFNRMDRLAELANELDVNLMIDAEHTYFQPSIDSTVLKLQRKYNVKKPIIFGTYQCYLTSSEERVSLDLERSKREGWIFGCKLVRGAYMVHENNLAEEQGKESPIYQTIEETHANYNKIVDLLIKDSLAHVMIATHNQESCEVAIRSMNECVEDPSEKVYFGQLLGMADHLTFALGSHGYNAYKYLPYGRIEEVLPYLIRRAQENAGLMAGAVHERELILNEIKRRLRAQFN